MISSLLIKNYAIIKELNVNFTQGFCVITGETGAGKSIIMGALGLILGQRADTSALNNSEEKCIIEGKFLLNGKIDLTNFFKQNDLDFENPIVLRREITPLGKSRAFINDTPVSLNLLRELGLNLIDIHSQHSNLDLGKHQFQLNVIDWFGSLEALLNDYSVAYKEYRRIELKLKEITEKSNQSKADFDYYEFQFKQLNEAKLVDGEQQILEKEQEYLTHSEEIKSGLNQVYQLLDREDQSIIVQMKEAVNVMNKLISFLPEAKLLHERLESQFIELRDIANECELLAEKTEYDPARLEEISFRLDTIYMLEQKHRVDSIAELISIRDEFDLKLQAVASFEEELLKLKQGLADQKSALNSIANKLTKARKAQVSSLQQEIITYLQLLGMPNATFTVDISAKEDFSPTGIDEVSFLFNANKGGQPEEINKVASGGELSRVMLAIKSVIAKSRALPAIIFDEIDTGISGEIASKMGNILKEMSQFMQVINITHLPQIASKGDSHLFVYKNDTAIGVETGMKLLDNDERVIEIAKMLSGDNPSLEAIANAKSLLLS